MCGLLSQQLTVEVHICLEDKVHASLVCAHGLVHVHVCDGSVCACVCVRDLVAGVEPDTTTLVCANAGKTFQSVMNMGFVWQSPSFCGAPGLLWA